MKLVVDALPLRGTSVSIVLQHVLAAWVQAHPEDELHLVSGPDAGVEVPPSVTRHVLELGAHRALGRVRRQNVDLPLLCRRVRADALLAPLPSTAVTPVGCARGVIQHDLRHELRPEQFGTVARNVRRASYSACFRQADAIACISQRSKDDLLRSRPWLARRDVRVVRHGADHVAPLRAMRTPRDYALAFGQYRNKRVDSVLRAWHSLARAGEAIPLRIVGLGPDDRAAVLASIAELGLSSLVRALPWLPAEEFEQQFADAALVVFASDFEGFGLPAVEAMALEIPLVITPEPALVEVTAGLASIAVDWGQAALADAVRAARAGTPEHLRAARAHAETFTWNRSAISLRAMLADAVARQ